MTRELRLAGSVSATQAERDGAATVNAANGNASGTYTPQGLSLGAWRYTPSAGASVGVIRSSDAGERRTLVVQAGQGVSRSVALRETDNMSFNLTQSAGALRDSQTQAWTRALSHSAGIYWQGTGDAVSQSYAGLSASDSRT